MRKSVRTRMLDTHFVEGAGHWVQQERPQEVSNLLVRFLKELRTTVGDGLSLALIGNASAGHFEAEEELDPRRFR